MTGMLHRLPDIVIIGAMKAGTTSVFQYLASHPQVSRGKRKEPAFFTNGQYQNGLKWYTDLFPENDKLKIEASTNYTKYPQFGPVAQRMHATLPDAKLIYLVRHPVDRVISQMHHLAISRGRTTDIIGMDRIVNASGDAINISSYFYQLSQFLEYYDLSRISIQRFEDLLADPVHVMHQISRFLEIHTDFYTDHFNFRRHNDVSTSARVKYRKLHFYLYKAHLHLHFPPIHKLFETPIPRPQLTLEAKQYIWDAVQEDLRQFEQLIGRSLQYARPA